MLKICMNELLLEILKRGCLVSVNAAKEYFRFKQFELNDSSNVYEILRIRFKHATCKNQ